MVRRRKSVRADRQSMQLNEGYFLSLWWLLYLIGHLGSWCSNKSLSQWCSWDCGTSTLLLSWLVWLSLLFVNGRSYKNRLPLLSRWSVGLALLIKGKTGGGLLRRLQMRNWTAVIRFNFVGFNFLVDEVADQLLWIIRTSCVKTSTDLIVGSTLVRGTKLSSSVIQFLRGTFVLFTQRQQRITKNEKLSNETLKTVE